MARFTGGTNVKSGYYWNVRSWEVQAIAPGGGKLKGPSDARYLKVPFPVLFVMVPFLGLLFLLFLPFIGFALFAFAAGKKIAAVAGQSATELASTLEPGKLVAGEAHFAGKPGERGERGGSEKTEDRRTAAIAKLEDEIARRKERE